MESEVVLENVEAANGAVMILSNGNGLQVEVIDVGKDKDGLEAEVIGVEKEAENLGNELLEDLDSYLEDINDRLMILRMVNDSVIKGMVNAVEQEAAEKIAEKESEVVQLKELLRLNEVKGNEIECLSLPVKGNESGKLSCHRYLSYFDACTEHKKMRESVVGLNTAAKEQFAKVKKEIDVVRGYSIMKRIGSGSELVGLGGILRENGSESIDSSLDNVSETVNAISRGVDDVLQSSEIFLRELQQEQEFQREIEAMVLLSSIRSLKEEFEEKLWDQSARFQSVNWTEKFNQLSALRTELDSMLKLLTSPEIEHPNSNGSHDTDNSHSKSQGNHLISSATLWQGNGRLEESKIDMPENFDAAQLKHMTKDDLVHYFNSAITKMRRDHESIVQKKTEENFSLKREYLKLKERGSSLPHRKDNKEIDTIKKKIPDVILELDKILVENERIPAISYDSDCLKKKLDNLLLENRQLQDRLDDMKNEVNSLSSQLSDAEEKLLQYSLAEAKMQNVISNLTVTVEDAHIEAAMNGLIHKCFMSGLIHECSLKELSGRMRCDSEETNLEFLIMQEIYSIILKEVAGAESSNKCDVEDSDLESLIVQEICSIIHGETIKNAEQKLEELHSKYLIENEKSISLEKKAFEKESRLWVIIEEKERLRQEVLTMEALLQEKQTLAGDLAVSLGKEREHCEQLSEKLRSVSKHVSQQEILASERSKESELLRVQLAKALQQIKENELEICRLHQMHEEKTEKLKKANQEREAILALSEERHQNLKLVEVKEKEHKKRIEGIVINVHGLSKQLADFDCKVKGSIRTNSLRLEDSCTQLVSLRKKANSLRRTGLLYKERFERKCEDLQMAEAEVDLLGDEVESLLGLLEKIYIGLDHYSPILKHYHGIIEILELVKRELSGQSTKSVSSP